MLSDTWQAMGVTHGKPCVHLHVFTRHMATSIEGASSINRLIRRRRGEKERKREREEMREGNKKRNKKERKKYRKKKRKRERGRRPVVSSSVHGVLTVITCWTKE